MPVVKITSTDRPLLNRRALVGTALCLGLLTAGCAGASSSDAPTPGNASTTGNNAGPSSGAHGNSTPETDHEPMGGMAGMAGMGGMGGMDDHEGMEVGGTGRGGEGPTGTATMICSQEIADTVRRTFVLDSPPTVSEQWVEAERLYRCTYRLPGGTLRLSVQDALDQDPGRTYFEDLRNNLPGTKKLQGLENLGFPSFETPRGEVVFLKDAKTLLVDAASISTSGLPRGYSRTEAAYAVAAAVIACWTE